MRSTLVLVLCACGAADSQPAQPDATPATGWRELVMSSWTLPPGTEGYRCARRTLTAPAIVRAFRPVAPLGTHHTVLSLDDGHLPDGDTGCGPIAGARAVFMSGVGSPQFDLPENVAVRLPAGQQIVLNLHLYNTSADKALSGVSGVEIDAVAEGSGMAEAEIVLAGPFGFIIPEGHQELTFSCTTPAPTSLFAIAPHMHRLGEHMVVTRRGEKLIDVPYSFDQQHFYPVSVSLNAGERIDVTCGWNNDSGGPISWGDSSDAEMCFAVLYRTPIVPGGPFCLN